MKITRRQLRGIIRRALNEATQYDSKFKTLMDAGYDGIKQAMELADHLGIPSQELPWDYYSVTAYLNYRLENPDHKTYDSVESVNYYLEPVGWEYNDYLAAHRAMIVARTKAEAAAREVLNEKSENR